MKLRTVRATRYVTALREGGSLPAIVEGDDLGLYVLKFRGAGQGPLALVAELVAGELGRAVGLQIPEIVFVDVDEALGRNEPDEEVRDLLRASPGLNLALDYLPGSVMFDPAARQTVDPVVASQAVWFDAYISNVDRTARNPNLLWWRRSLYFIDHGAALYFHYDWDSADRLSTSAFAPIRNHVLLPWADRIDEAGHEMRSVLTESLLGQILNLIPTEWLSAQQESDADQVRQQYLDYFVRRRDASKIFEEEAMSAHASLV